MKNTAIPYDLTRRKHMNTNFAYELRTSYLDNEEFIEYQKSINILMHTIQSPVTLCHQLITEEWKHLFALMDILYGDALKIWLAKHDSLSEEETALCYFCYVGVKHKNLAIFFGISSQSLSKRKQRLRDKLLIPQGMSFKDAVDAV